MSWFKRFLRLGNRLVESSSEAGQQVEPSRVAVAPPRLTHRVFNVYSRLLGDPEFVFLILSTSTSVGSVKARLPRDGYAAVVELGRAALRVAGATPSYLVAYSGGVVFRGLAFNGKLLGAFAEAGGRRAFGVEAVQLVAEAGEVIVSVSRITPRIAEWRPEYSVYVRSLDAQHRRFFELLNTMYEVIVTGRVEDSFEKVLRGLRDYVNGHFRSEEAIMEKYGYPDEQLETHRAEHRRFKSIVEDYSEEYSSDAGSVNVRMFYVVRDWFKDHILGSDRMYGEFFKSIGIKVE